MSFHQNKPIVSYETWATALLSSAAIGCTSLVPWLFNLTFFERHNLKLQPDGDGRMKYLLSFSIGAILGDIFFHLIPESYHSHLNELNFSHDEAHKRVGFSIIAGIFMFIIVEMVLEKWSKSSESNRHDLDVHPKEVNQLESKSTKSNGKSTRDDLKRSRVNDCCANNSLVDYNSTDLNCNEKLLTNEDEISLFSEINDYNHNVCQSKSLQQRNIKTILSETKTSDVYEQTKSSIASEDDKTTVEGGDPVSGQIVETAGYLSLIANGFDNFTHGLAIGASFLVGPKVGLLTTFVIFIHEIPHEICDYAILVNSGFSRLDAVKAQSSVSLFGILGTAIALYVKSLETLNSKTIWILPFSAGGFLYIALVNLLPDILEQDTDVRKSMGQIACVILGISFMGAIAII